MRKSDITRKTAETDITLSLCLDGTGKSEISTGIGFLDHMLTSFSRHARFDLSVKCVGDTFTDDHHSAEDIGLCLGMAFAEAVGDMRGIVRFADVVLPMDEALCMCAVDVSGRGYLAYDITPGAEKVGGFDTELVKEFFLAFVRKAEITVHIKQLAGENVHHIIEACFKAFARALSAAVSVDKGFADEIPSTKGVL